MLVVPFGGGLFRTVLPLMQRPGADTDSVNAHQTVRLNVVVQYAVFSRIVDVQSRIPLFWIDILQGTCQDRRLSCRWFPGRA